MPPYNDILGHVVLTAVAFVAVVACLCVAIALVRWTES